jgi:spore coat protein A
MSDQSLPTDLSRRDLLKTGTLAAVALCPIHRSSLIAAMSGPAQTSPVSAGAASVPQTLDPSTLQPFVDPLPIPRIAKPSGTRSHPDHPAQQIPCYRIPLHEAMQKVHRDLPATRMWTFDGSFPGPTLEMQSGQPVIVEWVNQLPAKHFLPIDHTLMGAELSQPEVRSVVHLHGGRTPAASDGYPEEWTVPGKAQTCFYPSPQDAALLFYHDHTMGINRLNIYAGLQGFAIVRDPAEAALNLPAGKFEIPLMIADRLLRTDGSLDYPVSPDPKSPWVPEVFGNAILANGKLLPYLDVEPRAYRFRVMNGSNGRFYRFALSNEARFQVIGNDQGLLSAPVPVKRIPLAPAERADILVDFTSMAGQRLQLVSDSFDILEFRVGKADNAAPKVNATIPTLLHAMVRLDPATATKTRQLTLDEKMNNVQDSMGMLLNNTPWHAPVTEKPILGSTEIWEFVNLTDDSHPIHLHLVRFQILDRRRFDRFDFQAHGKVRFMGPVQPPEPFEMGWKDTVRADPGMITRILIPFEHFAGRYVWHCHILEHEDNEMMRPYEVLPAPRIESLLENVEDRCATGF